MRCRSIRRLDLRSEDIVHKAEKLSPGKKRHVERRTRARESVASLCNLLCLAPDVFPTKSTVLHARLGILKFARHRSAPASFHEPSGRGEFKMRTGAVAQSHPPIKLIGARLQPSGIHDVAWVKSSLDRRDRLYAELGNVRSQPR
jgi:hypothetical protein